MTASKERKIPNKVLVTGASGPGGRRDRELSFRGLEGDRRLMPQARVVSGRAVDFLSVDLRDEERTRAAFEPLTDITHIAYTALHEKPELAAGLSSKEQIETNNAMLHNVMGADFTHRLQLPAH